MQFVDSRNNLKNSVLANLDLRIIDDCHEVSRQLSTEFSKDSFI